ncbi:hypothetical protein [Hyphomicrobium sp.]|uniref:hypothetical protein n=1 Tax=Hyphomicrobium sp. TaxID=82 RepID=UPI003F71DD40
MIDQQTCCSLKTASGIDREELLRTNDAVVNDIRGARILEARIHHDGPAFFNLAANGPLHSRDLAADANRVALEACKAVHVNAGLAVHEIDEIPEDRKLRLRLFKVDGHVRPPCGSDSELQHRLDAFAVDDRTGDDGG